MTEKDSSKPWSPCPHTAFAATVDVCRLHDQEAFVAELAVHCSSCGTKFQFLGLPIGIDTQGAMMSGDGLIARIACYPSGTMPDPSARRVLKNKPQGKVH